MGEREWQEDRAREWLMRTAGAFLKDGCLDQEARALAGDALNDCGAWHHEHSFRCLLKDELSWNDEEIDRAVAEVYGAPQHLYEGDCPYGDDTEARDPDCPACQAMGHAKAAPVRVQTAARSTVDMYSMSPDEAEAQRRSFAFGNVGMSNPKVTRAVVDEAAARMDAPDGPFSVATETATGMPYRLGWLDATRSVYDDETGGFVDRAPRFAAGTTERSAWERGVRDGRAAWAMARATSEGRAGAEVFVEETVTDAAAELGQLLNRLRGELRGGDTVADALEALVSTHDERRRRAEVGAENVVELRGGEATKKRLVDALRDSLRELGGPALRLVASPEALRPAEEIAREMVPDLPDAHPGIVDDGACVFLDGRDEEDVIGAARGIIARLIERSRAEGAAAAQARIAKLEAYQARARPEHDSTALISAIRALTVDSTDDEPNGEVERQLQRLALMPGVSLTALDALEKLSEALVNDVRALRSAAEAYFGGDFGKPADGSSDGGHAT